MVTQILRAAKVEDSSAAREVLHLVYDEPRRVKTA